VKGIETRFISNNAKIFLSIQAEYGSFDAYVWRFVDGEAINESLDVCKGGASDNTSE
jgi:3-methyladenine DNA glycosylase Tag